MRPPLGNENCGRIRGVAAGEGLIRYVYKGFVLKNCGRIRGFLLDSVPQHLLQEALNLSIELKQYNNVPTDAEVHLSRSLLSFTLSQTTSQCHYCILGDGGDWSKVTKKNVEVFLNTFFFTSN